MQRGKYTRTPEINQKSSLSKKGNKFNLGKYHTEETKRKISKFRKGKKLSEETKRKIGLSHKGKKLFPMSQEQKDKISKTLKLRKKKRISEARKREKNPNWKGGISFEPYAIDWTETLRRGIRERDRYICRLCGELQSKITFAVHHIDYEKSNCNPKNLITLCYNCHSKTNFHREKWEQYFTNLLS